MNTTKSLFVLGDVDFSDNSWEELRSVVDSHNRYFVCKREFVEYNTNAFFQYSFHEIFNFFFFLGIFGMIIMMKGSFIPENLASSPVNNRQTLGKNMTIF